MKERRSLTEGLKATPPVDPVAAREFVYGHSETPVPEGRNAMPAREQAPTSANPPGGRVPVSTRMRSDYATALKRASLERQLQGIEPYTLTDILEQAVEPWLRANGYIP